MNSAGTRPAWLSHALKLLLIAAGLCTVVLATRTFWYLFQSITNVPYTDSWALLEEVRRFRQGEVGWTWLWEPYWGQRNLVARALFLLSVKYLSFHALPLILVNVAAQLSVLAVLIHTGWSLFRGSTRLAFACAIAFTNLVLSSLAMELLVVPQNVSQSIGYASAISAILLFPRRRWLGILLALLATASLAIGLGVWPILLIEAWRGRLRPRIFVVLACLSIAITALYLIGYSRPPSFGMGVAGALFHPSMTALVLGGPITLYSLRLGTIAGGIGLAALAWFVVFGNRAAFPLIMAACFLAAVAASLVAGRISPEWIASLHGAQPLPSRYIAPMLIFWGCLGALTLTQKHPLPRTPVFAILITIMFGTVSWQWRVPREWAVAYQKFDAIAAGFLVGVSDPEQMATLFTDAPLRGRLVDYMRRERLAIFADRRAGWLGASVPPRPCPASISAVPLEGGLRLTGAAETTARDLPVVDGRGVVVGLVRTLPAQSEGRRARDFLGYARADSAGHLSIVCGSDHFGQPLASRHPLLAGKQFGSDLDHARQ